MLERMANTCTGVYHFLIGDTYPAKELTKIRHKLHYSFGRMFFVNFIGKYGSIYCAINASLLSANVGWAAGATMGGTIGTLVFPGPGTAIGATVGGGIGALSGGVVGWKLGIEAGGFIAVNFARQASRAISAIFNFNEANPTNPNKYKLSKANTIYYDNFFTNNFFANQLNNNRSENSSNSIVKSLQANVSNQNVIGKKSQSNSEFLNEKLAECYQWKKELVKPNPILRILGLSRFFQEVNEDLNEKINRAAGFLRVGRVDAYSSLKTELRR